MAFRTWGRLLLTALGVSVLAGAGQLGIAYGFGIVRLTGAFTDVNRWPAQLAWVGWFAVTAAVVGAVVTVRLARRDGLPDGTGVQLAVSGAAALGATVVAPLCMQPARAAELSTADPVWAVGICAVVGAVVGAGAASAVLLRPPLGWNVALLTGAVWLIALVSVAPALFSTGPLRSVRLGVLEPSWLDAVAAQRLAMLVLPAVALLAGAATGALARWRGHVPLVSGAAGAAGPVLLAFAYLTAGPGNSADRYQLAPYYGAVIAVAAGALGSAAAALVRWPLFPATGAHSATRAAIEPTDILRPLPDTPALSPAADGRATVDLAGTDTSPGTGTPTGAELTPGRSAEPTPAHWDWPVTPGTPNTAPASFATRSAGDSAVDVPATGPVPVGRHERSGGQPDEPSYGDLPIGAGSPTETFPAGAPQPRDRRRDPESGWTADPEVTTPAAPPAAATDGSRAGSPSHGSRAGSPSDGSRAGSPSDGSRAADLADAPVLAGDPSSTSAASVAESPSTGPVDTAPLYTGGVSAGGVSAETVSAGPVELPRPAAPAEQRSGVEAAPAAEPTDRATDAPRSRPKRTRKLRAVDSEEAAGTSARAADVSAATTGAGSTSAAGTDAAPPSGVTTAGGPTFAVDLTPAATTDVDPTSAAAVTGDAGPASGAAGPTAGGAATARPTAGNAATADPAANSAADPAASSAAGPAAGAAATAGSAAAPTARGTGRVAGAATDPTAVSEPADSPTSASAEGSGTVPTVDLDRTTLAQAAPDQATLDRTTPDQAAPDQATLNRATPDQAAPDQAASDQAALNRTTPDQATPDRTALRSAPLAPAAEPAPRPRHQLPDLNSAVSWNAFTAPRPAPAPPRAELPFPDHGPTEAPKPVTFRWDADTSGPGTSGTATDLPTADAPDQTVEARAADASPGAGAEPATGRTRSKRGLFRRNKARAAEPPAETPGAEPLAAQDEEYVDWVTGLSRPLADNEPETESGRRSLRSSGRHHRD